MNNKKIFSFHLFVQTLKQTRLVGFIIMAVYALFSAVPIISRANSIKEYMALGIDSSTSAEVVNAAEEDVWLGIVTIFACMLLSYVVWSFINKRSSCDFYHSLPYTRMCLYISKALVPIAWMFAIYVVSFCLQAALYLTYSKYFVVNYGDILLVFFMYYIMALLVMATINVAVSLAGTLMSSICITGLIMFLPRFITMIVMEYPSIFSNGYLVMNGGSGVLSYKSNLIFGCLLSVYGVEAMVYSVLPYVYSFVLAAVYMALGAVVFVRRKSETAGKAAGGKVLPMIIRVLIGFVIAFTGLAVSETAGLDKCLNIIIFFAVSALAVLIYEWIVSRKMMVFKACIPAIIIGYILAAAVNMGAVAYGKTEAAYVPDAESVKYVTFLTDGGTDSYSEYYSSVTSQIKFDDEETIEFLADIYAENKEKIDKANSIYAVYPYSEYTRLEVHFEEGIFGHDRIICLSAGQVEKLGKMLEKNDNYKEAYMDFPDVGKVSVSIYGDMDEKAGSQIYSSLVAEAEAMGFSKWYNHISSGDTEALFHAYVQFSRSGKNYYMSIPINSDLPETLKLYVKARNDYSAENNAEEIERIIKMLDISDMSLSDLAKAENGTEYLSIALLGEDGTVYNSLYDIVANGDDEGRKFVEEMYNAVKNGSYTKEIDASKPLVVINYSGCYDDEDDSMTVSDSTYCDCDIIIQVDDIPNAVLE